MATTEYAVWRNMKNRCYNKNDAKKYENWGGRGITVYEEWLHDFKAFHDHIGDRPTPKHSIDRINNEGNYEPGNVRWATHKEQPNNRRDQRDRHDEKRSKPNKNNVSGALGVSWHKHSKMWRVQIRKNYKNITVGYYRNLLNAIEISKQREQE